MKRLATLSALILGIASLLGCGSKMDAKECDKIRGEAFDLVNSAQHCSTDADCKQSEWPGCARAVNAKTVDTIKPMAENFKKGQCEEAKMDCKAPPEAYCKQGLCVHREKGTTEGAGAPAGDIIVK
ncbi:hypothetical protein [Polyangium aurulentum]|uniref:hypothetical protein n=1 Tax=Polyangium aurulentum TaxID=2567896 RepID=UPI0010AE2FBC|nr:hypothetical protein [Polyangium aurulentum]UQA55655.1 hypothetical protein E8A73_030500 [Polyangium aurulentum]